MDARLSEIGQIAIVVSDVEKVLPFYRDVLGLPYLFSPSPHQAFLSAGPVRIMLSVPEGAGTAGKNSILYFKVKDICLGLHEAGRTRRGRGARTASCGENRRIMICGLPSSGIRTGTLSA